MSVDAARWVRGQASGIRSWQVWALPGWLSGFIVAVVVADVAALVVAVAFMPFRLHDLELFVALVACSAATVEITRRLGETAGVIKDVYAIWELPAAVLLPIAYVPIVPALRFIMTQLRVRHVPLHRRSFSAAAIGISYIVAALLFHQMIR